MFLATKPFCPTFGPNVPFVPFLLSYYNNTIMNYVILAIPAPNCSAIKVVLSLGF